MRWYVSYPVLAAGLAFGFETLFPDAPDFSRSNGPAIHSHTPHEAEAGPVVLMASEIEAVPATRLSQFSPGARLLSAEPVRTSSSVLDYLAQTFTPRERAPAPAPETPVVLAEWKSAVVRDVPPAAAPASAAPAVSQPVSRAALARDIQRELQRVGCYLGEIDGVWGGGSKRAVMVFMDRVNATLPTREPDVFMLSLLRAQATPVCGETCPRGQSFTASGRCMPSTLVAQADRARDAHVRGEEAWEPVVAEAAPAPRPVPYGRMSIGGPRPDDVAELSSGTANAPAAGLERTAALEVHPDGDAGAGGARAAVSSFDYAADAIPEQRVKPAVNRTKSTRERTPRRSSSYRQVQHLFTHPLGRM